MKQCVNWVELPTKCQKRQKFGLFFIGLFLFLSIFCSCTEECGYLEDISEMPIDLILLEDGTDDPLIGYLGYYIPDSTFLFTENGQISSSADIGADSRISFIPVDYDEPLNVPVTKRFFLHLPHPYKYFKSHDIDTIDISYELYKVAHCDGLMLSWYSYFNLWYNGKNYDIRLGDSYIGGAKIFKKI